MEAVKCAKPLEINRKENLKNHKWYWIGRRTQDVILSLIALVVLSPVMLITAIAIMIDDPSAGPIFSQIRIGRNGKPFKFYKFRSMCANAEAELDDLLDQNEMDGPVFKIKEDPRITRVGKFIRKTSIDELPQLWNILKGDMSIVGPRPALPREVEQYTQYDWQRLYTDGIYGGRFSGAGFKGCCMALIDPDKAEDIEARVTAEYLKAFPALNGKYSFHLCESADGVEL